MKVCFSCQVCGSVECRNENGNLNCFDIVGYEDCVKWSESSDSIPDKNKSGWWMRLDKMPSLSEYRVVHVKKPFNENVGSLFWTLFIPALSSINGLEEHIQEIETSAFVSCKIDSVLSSNTIEAWVRVFVCDVKPLKDFSSLLRQTQEEIPIWNHMYDFERDHIIKYKDWIYYAGSAQGDLGNWLIIKIIEGTPFLVALGEWTHHQDTSYMCNMILSHETYARVLQAEEIVQHV